MLTPAAVAMGVAVLCFLLAACGVAARVGWADLGWAALTVMLWLTLGGRG